MAAVFFHDDEQKRLALLSKDRMKEQKKNIYTKILPLTNFYNAEDYHQKHRLRSDRDIMREFNAMYPAYEDFINSTAAARINGYLSGYGSFEDLKDELSGFGLSHSAERKLLKIVKNRKGKIAWLVLHAPGKMSGAFRSYDDSDIIGPASKFFNSIDN